MIERREFMAGLGAAGLSSAILLQRAGAQSLSSVKGVYAAPGLSFSAIFLADKLGLWAKHGIAAEMKQVQGGLLTMAALTNHEASIAGIASTDPIVGWEKGIKTLSVGAFTGSLAMQFTARKDWMSRTGVSSKSSLEDRLKAFKGARIGASTVAAGPAVYTRYLARTVGVEPDQDMKILAVGFGAARIAALRANQVDITVGDAPEADQVDLEGFGELYIDCAHEIPVFKEFPYTVFLVTPEFANEQPDIVRRVSQTLGQANDLYTDNFGQVFDLIKKQYPTVPVSALERSLQRDRDTYPRGCRMTTAMWDNAVKVYSAIKLITTPVPSKEGDLWTNKFLS